MGLHSSQNPNLFTKISTSNRDEPQFCDIMSLAANQKERREILLTHCVMYEVFLRPCGIEEQALGIIAYENTILHFNIAGSDSGKNSETFLFTVKIYLFLG